VIEALFVVELQIPALPPKIEAAIRAIERT
jgi:hypothetical protein